MSMSSKQTTENKPPAWAVPLFEQSASEAQKIYDSGKGGNVYQGQTVAGLGDNTKAGIAGISSLASDPTYSNKLSELGTQATQTGNFLSNNALGIKPVSTSGYGAATDAANGISSTANNLLSGIASGSTGIGTEGDYRGLLDRAQNPFASEKNLADMASGTYLKSGNPYFEDALKGQLDKTSAQVQSQFAGSGRYGSGANTSVLTNELGGIRANALSDQFNKDTANMLAANGMLDAATANRLGIQNSAIAGITGVQGQNIANRLAGAGQIIGAQTNTANSLKGIQDSISSVDAANADRELSKLTTSGNLLNQGITSAATLAGQDQQNKLANAQALMGAGQVEDQNKQQQLQADYAKWLGEDMKDWTRLGLLQSAAAGAAANYGTNVQTSTQPFNPLSALGGIGSLASKSDIRAKERIVPVGVENGHTVYEFSYRGSSARWRGVMAQEVAEKDPLAVTVTDDGFLAVDYGRIGVECRKVA